MVSAEDGRHWKYHFKNNEYQHKRDTFLIISKQKYSYIMTCLWPREFWHKILWLENFTVVVKPNFYFMLQWLWSALSFHFFNLGMFHYWKKNQIMSACSNALIRLEKWYQCLLYIKYHIINKYCLCRISCVFLSELFWFLALSRQTRITNFYCINAVYAEMNWTFLNTVTSNQLMKVFLHKIDLWILEFLYYSSLC